MKILLLGKDGQIGWELQRSLAPLGEVCALGRVSTAYCGDLANLVGLSDTVMTLRPDVIVNAAAYTAVDAAEDEPELASAVNAEAPGLLADLAERTGAWLVHYSSDYVFDGNGSKPWREIDTPAPLSIYGRSKLEGERLVAARCAKHLIFRSSWVYAARGDNFAKTILRLAAERDKLSVVAAQVGAPTGADLIADVTAHALRRIMGHRTPDAEKYSGVYHLAAGGAVSRHRYATFLLETAQSFGAALRVNVASIEPARADEFPTRAARPLNSRLDTQKLESTFDLSLPHWEAGVERMLSELLPMTVFKP